MKELLSAEKDRSIKAVIARLRFGDSDGDDHDIAANELECLEHKRAEAVESFSAMVVKVAQLQAADQWQPIEMKPPGRVLLWFPDLGYPVTGDSEIYSYVSGGWKATHWRPSPPAPQVERACGVIMPKFYDEQMAVAVELAMDYLLSERGQTEMRKAAQESKALADKFRRMRDVPWDLLHKPFTI
jgi:hypothetical protein